jgi:predicted Rossmann-fold nucleotide-binding protein
MEEFFEVWTWRQLGYHDKPIGLLDANGYYAKLIAFLNECVQHAFMDDRLMQLVRIGSEPRALLEALVRDAAGRSSQLEASQI